MLKNTVIAIACAASFALGAIACENPEEAQQLGLCGEDDCEQGVELSTDPMGPSEYAGEELDESLGMEGDEAGRDEKFLRSTTTAGPAAGNATAFTVTLTLTSQPIHNNFTRHITFQNYAGAVIRVPIAFSKKATLVYSGSADASGLATLATMNQTGNRWFWDKMFISNLGGDTALAIGNIKAVITYGNTSIGQTTLAFVDGALNKTLTTSGAGTNLDLAVPAKAGRLKIAGMTEAQYTVQPAQLRLAINDIGKAGTDGAHENSEPWPFNPKYTGGTSSLCSEFTSWYMHQAGKSTTAVDFKDVTSTITVMNAFAGAGRLYCYNNARLEWNLWRNMSGSWNYDTTVRYTPRPGDYLIRKPNAGTDTSEHSMLLVSWTPSTANPSNSVARVVNGPWPVTLRNVRVHAEEIDPNLMRDYCVGKM